MSTFANITIAVDPVIGSLLRAWFVYDSGSSGPGTVQGQFRFPGDTAWSATFTFKDTAGTDIPVADGGWGHLSKSGYYWVMAILKDGDSVVTDWFSIDQGRTWQQSS